LLGLDAFHGIVLLNGLSRASANPSSIGVITLVISNAPQGCSVADYQPWIESVLTLCQE
jgi:hypothetical protein